jgi:hypothetical protein
MLIKDCIQKSFEGCRATKCSENECKLKFTDIRNHLILKGELISKSKYKICDYIIFVNRDSCTICLLELRSNNVDASEIIKKFENAENVIKSFLRDCGLKESKFKYYPILLSKSINRFEHENITCKKIFGEKIITEDCGEKLQNIFNKY